MSVKLLPFDMVSLLDGDELLRALGYIAKAKGMAMIAKESGLGRESLYKALSPGSQPHVLTRF